jgi:6-pyruvoyltetrahydropterin/6-carboxytetrahydropterin synthase
MYELTINASFSSAHNLREYGGACERLHGHNWDVEVTIGAEKLGVSARGSTDTTGTLRLQ